MTCEDGCTDACDHRWHITPHPFSRDFDTYVTDGDQDALDTLRAAVEYAWDDAEVGKVYTVTLTLRRE